MARTSFCTRLLGIAPPFHSPSAIRPFSRITCPGSIFFLYPGYRKSCFSPVFSEKQQDCGCLPPSPFPLLARLCPVPYIASYFLAQPLIPDTGRSVCPPDPSLSSPPSSTCAITMLPCPLPISPDQPYRHRGVRCPVFCVRFFRFLFVSTPTVLWTPINPSFHFAVLCFSLIGKT